VEGYETTKWVYEGTKAPVGMKRLTVDFGLLTPQGYRPPLVRSFSLEPKPGIFTRRTVINGWGRPSRVGTQDGQEVFFYVSGLVVHFGKGEANAVVMLFTVPQPEPPKPAGR
jgi:hypothetical protein